MGVVPCYAVVVVEPIRILRDALVGLLRRDPACRHAHGTDGESALIDLVLRERPELVILDPEALDHEPQAVLSALGATDGGPRVLAYAADRRIETVHSLLRAGVAGFVSKDTDRRGLLQAVHQLAAGQIALAPDLQAGLTAFLLAAEATRQRPRLSGREAAVLGLAAQGCSSHEIAKQLYLATPTVKTHLRNAYEKLGARNRPSAVAEAIRLGLLREWHDHRHAGNGRRPVVAS